MIAPALCGNSSREAAPGWAGRPGKSTADAPNVPSTYPMSDSWAPHAIAISSPSPVLPSPPIATASAHRGAKVRSSRGLWVKPPVARITPRRAVIRTSRPAWLARTPVT